MLWLEQIHRRGADEDGRGGRAPGDRQNGRKFAAQQQNISPKASGRWYKSVSGRSRTKNRRSCKYFWSVFDTSLYAVLLRGIGILPMISSNHGQDA
ncbi:MAG: hypothetical protein ACKOFH_15285, partial [Chthoniobacterales bacterium]